MARSSDHYVDEEPYVDVVQGPESDGPPDAQDLELWESETDTLSVHRVREVLDQVLAAPGVEPALQVLLEGFSRALTEVAQGLRAPRPDRVIDRFGLDKSFYNRVFPLAEWLHDNYFRVESTGVENIPSIGRGLVVANHSGTLPYDGVMVAATTRIRHSSRRRVRPLVEDFVYHMPYLGSYMARVGAVRACQQNARSLLENDKVVLVFPKGSRGSGSSSVIDIASSDSVVEAPSSWP